jgi:hypothetical protein
MIPRKLKPLADGARVVVLAFVIAYSTASISSLPVGAIEPTFNPAADVSLFYDDFEAYKTTADLTTGPKAKYFLSKGTVNLMTSSGRNYAGGSKFTRFDYTASGEYANEIYTTKHRNRLLNTATTVVLTYGYRNTGTYYSGKAFIIRDLKGSNRFVLVGAAYFTTPPSLQNCWYGSDYPHERLYSYVQNRSGVTPTWSRDGLSAVGGPSPHFLKGNIGYPTVQFKETGTQVGPANDGKWHRFTYRFTKESVGGGRGRLEGWFDGRKFMEYIGDDPSRCEYRQVWTWGPTNSVWNNDLYFVGTTSGAMGPTQGAIVDMDGIRLWLPE